MFRWICKSPLLLHWKFGFFTVCSVKHNCTSIASSLVTGNHRISRLIEKNILLSGWLLVESVKSITRTCMLHPSAGVTSLCHTAKSLYFLQLMRAPNSAMRRMWKQCLLNQLDINRVLVERCNATNTGTFTTGESWWRWVTSPSLWCCMHSLCVSYWVSIIHVWGRWWGKGYTHCSGPTCLTCLMFALPLWGMGEKEQSSYTFPSPTALHQLGPILWQSTTLP